MAISVTWQFFNQARKSKASAETGYVFGELGVREDQYKLEKGAYLAAAACPATVPGPTGLMVASLQAAGGCYAPSTSAWDQLRVRIGEAKLYCQYTVVTGTGTGTSAPAGFTWSSPSTAWYYLLATCDTDGNAATNSQYFLASNDTTIQSSNEGR